jgi:hypothetical protein|tara:strand:+ start:805 stop:1392 length:588 start_codon:yes stop_codon:yes gene_type:complete
MIYTKEWAFIHIPKTAGLNFILRMEKKPEVINAQWNLQKKTGLKDVNHLPLQWWLDRGELNKEQYIFTFVRNPYSRIVSLYNHMLIEGRNIPGFKEFIMEDIVHTKNPPGLDYDFGWPQYKSIENNQGINVKCYKMETELPLVEEYIGYIFTDTRYNDMPHAPWQTYYDSETKEKVNEKYKEDFKRFNYNEHLSM